MPPKSLERYARTLERRASTNLLRTVEDLPSTALIDFSHNDILGLRFDASLQQASVEALHQYGNSSASSRVLLQPQTLFLEIEQHLAKLKGTETALLFNSGFCANSSVISALLNPAILKAKPLVFSDKLIHASIHQGIQLAGAKQIRFHHQNLDHLQQRLEQHKNHLDPKFIFVESLYGMRGSVTDLKKLEQIALEYDAFLYVDDAHSFGAYGHHGGGLSAHFANIHIHMGNFGKALGGFGGFVACSKTLKSFLINYCPGLIYSTALPPSVLGAQLAALKQLPQLQAKRETLHKNSQWVRARLLKLGVSVVGNSHIVALPFDAVEQARIANRKLLNARCKTSLIRPPTVPKPMLRVCIHANHSIDQLEHLVRSIGQVLESSAHPA